MVTFYQSQYHVIQYDPDNKVLLSHWTVKDDIDQQTYQQEAQKLIEAAEKFKPIALIVDTRDFISPMTPDIHRWTTNIITPVLGKNGVKRIAYLMPKPILSRLSIELLITEAKLKSQFVNREIFDDYEKAFNWAKQANKIPS